MKFWQVLVIALVGAANGAELPLDFTTRINNSETKFHCEKTVVLLYDIESRKTVVATSAADEVKFGIASLIKPIIIDEAIRQQAVTWDSVIDCNAGQLPVDGRILRDVVPLGKLSVTEVLIRRSNIGSYRILGKIGTYAISERLKAVGVISGKSLFDCAAGWGIGATASQVVRLYALMQEETKSKLPQPYLSTGLLDTDRDNKRYFPCALGFVVYNNSPHLLLVGMVNPHPVYYAGKTAKQLWLDLAAILATTSQKQ